MPVAAIESLDRESRGVSHVDGKAIFVDRRLPPGLDRTFALLWLAPWLLEFLIIHIGKPAHTPEDRLRPTVDEIATRFGISS